MTDLRMLRGRTRQNIALIGGTAGGIASSCWPMSAPDLSVAELLYLRGSSWAIFLRLEITKLYKDEAALFSYRNSLCLTGNILAYVPRKGAHTL